MIGGGLAGLTAAFRLLERGVPTLVLERDGRVGGQIHTLHEAGVHVELGAEGFVARSVIVPELCRALGIGDRLIDQASTTTFALERGELVELAPGEAAAILGFQVPKEELGRGIRSLAGGMGELVERLAAAIGERGGLRASAEVSAVDLGSAGPTVVLVSGERIDARGVVVATPARTAAALLEGAFGASAGALANGKLLSNASATLLYEACRVGASIRGSGFIVPLRDQQHGFRACSFVSTKFARPVPDGTLLFRAFFRPSDEDAAARDARSWVDLAASCLAGPLAIEAPPIRGWSSAWPSALPVYDDAYRAVVAAADATLERRGVVLAGSHFHGAGIDAAVASAERAAERASFTP